MEFITDSNLDLNSKFNKLAELSGLDLNTIEYLKSNGYQFQNNLHKFTLQSLEEKNYKIFEKLLFQGTWDDNYDVVIEKNCVDKNGYNFKHKTNLLYSMAENNYFEQKYYQNIIKSEKKNLNFSKKNGDTWIYNSIQTWTNKFSEYQIVDIIGNSKINSIHKNKKKYTSL